MPIRQGGRWAKTSNSRPRDNGRRTIVLPLLSTPCTWNTDLARSTPTVMATMAQASLDGVAFRPPSLPRTAVARAVHAIKCAVQRARYITLETIALLRDDLALMLPAAAA